MYLKSIIQRKYIETSIYVMNTMNMFNHLFCFQAVETLKMFEKKDSRVKSAAATNLSFLYFLVRTEL